MAYPCWNSKAVESSSIIKVSLRHIFLEVAQSSTQEDERDIRYVFNGRSNIQTDDTKKFKKESPRNHGVAESFFSLKKKSAQPFTDRLRASGDCCETRAF